MNAVPGDAATAAIPAPRSVSAAAAALHGGALVWDAHADSLPRALVEGYDLALPSPGHADLERWRAGGVNAQVLALWVDPIFLPHHGVRRALQQADVLFSLVERHPDRVGLARTAADVRRITGDGRLAALLALEGGAALQHDLAMLRAFHRLGVTSLTLTHSASTTWADASTDAPRWRGLNEFGRGVIRELNRIGMVADVSHVSDDCVADALAASRAPVIASHSCCRALCDHPRNLSDTLLRDIAAGGGVIGINFYPAFLDPAAAAAMKRTAGDLLTLLNRPVDVPPERLEALAAERHHAFFAADGLPPVSIDRVLDHIDHAVAVMGIDHVGLGSDFDGINETPEALSSVADFPRITEGLLARGHAAPDVAKVMGGNFLRVLADVQSLAG